MSNKKILSVKPTKNPCKFIFETEMPADELKKYVHEWFDDRACNVCIDSIKPSGLWANKLFVNVSFDQHELPGHALAELQRLMDDFNKNIESEEENFDWRIECHLEGENFTRIIASSQTAHYAALACQQNRIICIAESCIKPENVAFIWNVKTGEKLWPMETEQKKTYCEVIVADRSSSIYVTHEDVESIIKIIAGYYMCIEQHLQTAGCVHVQDIYHNELVLLAKDIKHIYDENGHDMLADGLAKAQKPKDIWHVEVRKQAYVKDNKFDLPARVGLSLLDQLQSGRDRVSFYDMNCKAYRFSASSILRLWNNEKTLWSHEDKKLGDFWHISVKTTQNTSFIPDYVYDVSPSMARIVIEALKIDACDAIYFVDINHKHHTINKCSVISIYDDSNNIHWSKKRDKKPDTSFNAPSLLSRIYE